MLLQLLLFLRSLILLPCESLDLFLVVTWGTSVSPRFWQIGCCPGLDLIVSQSQTAFIPNRSISENVLLAQELRNHKNKGQEKCTIKVELMKAYDSLDREFILHCLACFGAPSVISSG